MAPPVRQAFLREADIYWRGEPPPCFRILASANVLQWLTDHQWNGLLRILSAYSFNLNFEFQAGTLAEHKRAALKVADAADELIAAIEDADRREIGSVVSGPIGEEWEVEYDHGAEYDRDRGRMTLDIERLLEGEGAENPAERAVSLVASWQGLRLQRPEYPADFVVLLREFRKAAAKYASGVRGDDSLRHESLGGAWVNLIGQLTDWLRDDCGLPASASVGASNGNHGRIVALAKSINELIPIMQDTPQGRQMRRPLISDSSMADSIIKAQKEYDAIRPR